MDTATLGKQFGSFTLDPERRAKGYERGLSGLTNFGFLIRLRSIISDLASSAFKNASMASSKASSALPASSSGRVGD
ncbi:hypothetical protein [Haloferula sp. BvORR071]|uniref:hypothetical protein n=1 Tax=Haloferula sp. BvORR071 TaxID=1396141 RepID=UPI00054DE6AB|nr:hypothetical protein [Haloferula sp. BvORR071]